MDRGKNVPSKSNKSKPMGFTGDFIALGSKQSRPEPVDGKIKSAASSSAVISPNVSSLAANLANEKKREMFASQTSSQASKKLKTESSSSVPFNALRRPPLKVHTPTSPSLNRPERWEEVAIEVEAFEFLNSIMEAESNEDEERIEALLCGCVKQLRTTTSAQRNKILTLALLYLAKCRPHYFNTELTVDSLLFLLKRDTIPAAGPFKGKTALTSTLACNLLLAGCQEEHNWPESFLKVFIEDSVGERAWVDRDECQGFVENILTAFNTKMTPKNILQHESGTGTSSSSGAASSPSLASLAVVGMDEEASVDSDISQSGLVRAAIMEQQQVPIVPRYQSIREVAEALVIESVKEPLSRRQQPLPDLITKNFIKFLASVAGLAEVRLLAAPRLEMWLSNPKLSRPATELLLAICINCNTETVSDTDTINSLLRLRLKAKGLIQTYLTCFKELVDQQLDQLPLILRLLIFNELSPARGPNNMAILAVMFQNWPELSASYLADVFMELLLNREDYLRALRALLREVVRALRYDLPLHVFCAALFQATLHEKRENIMKDFEYKERLLNSLADLTTLCTFMSIGPVVRESASLIARGDLRELEHFRQFQTQAATMQCESIRWLYSVIPSIFKPTRPEQFQFLHKVLFMENADQYYNKDGWPPESDRAVFLRLASETPILEDTLIHILLIGLSKDHPMPAPDTLELCDQLLRRCAAAHNATFAMIQAEKVDIFDMMLTLTAYHHPENIALPQGYIPPNLAISVLYWKAWLMLLLLTAHNPTSFGSAAWNLYPTLRALMEMCITNSFTSSSALTTTPDQQEIQIATMEKQKIIEFETYLAAASTKTVINENNSLLLSQLTTLDPRGHARRPPPSVIDQLRTLNGTLKLGHLLCRSRQPDFLLEILHTQGPAQSMPWLADLVETNEGSWSLLPVQCLCEFLLHEAAEDPLGRHVADLLDDSKQQSGKRKERRHKQQQLVQHLQLLLKDANQTADACREVLDYLCRRLSSKHAIARLQALAALSVVFSSKDEDMCSADETLLEGVEDESRYSWLLHHLPNIPHFEFVRPSVIVALRAALLVETQPNVVASYLKFLSSYALDGPLQDLADLTLDLAQLIVDRSSLFRALLCRTSSKKPVATKTLQHFLILFWHYLLKARESNKESYTWSENQDQVLVQWQSREAATLHILVIRAMVVLLTHGPPPPPSPQSEPDSQVVDYFSLLQEMWFPSNGQHPQVYFVETSEEALLYPDWLKLRMIKSNVPVLVDTALKDLEPRQLILFIQSFGIPVSSMSKLLQALDRMVQTNPFAFVEVDIDKVYMKRLLQVQWQEGATGGLHFTDIMQLNEPEPSMMDSKDFQSSLRPTLDLTSRVSSGAIPPLNQEQVVCVLRQLLDVKTVIRLSQPEKMKAFRHVRNAVAAEVGAGSQPSTEAVVAAMESLLDGASSQQELDALLAAMESQTAFSCGLLRLITSVTATSPLSATVLKICRKVSQSTAKGGDSTSPLKSIALRFMKNNGSEQPKAALVGANLLDLTCKSLEKHLQQLALRALANEGSHSLVNDIVNNLSNCRFKDNFAGLLVDWLELLDPEIISTQPDVETCFLFGKSSGKTNYSCRPYALALLVHQASWTTLWKCIQQLLGDKNCETFEPKIVLDFLTALIQVPKLWQGRDKHVPKHQQPEELLGLSHQQLARLTDYITSEHVSLSAESDPLRTQQVLEERCQLLISCCGGCTKTEVTLARNIAHKVHGEKRSSAHKKAAEELLLQFYVQVPHIAVQLAKSCALDASVAPLTTTPCALDTMALMLITCLTTPLPGKDGERTMSDLETALRKMAATHPLLLLRQFSSLAAALRGRAHLDMVVLVSRNHLNVFASVLGLAQQLSYKLFTAQHRDAFQDMLASYWTLFEYHLSSKEPLFGSLLQQFLQLMLSYLSASPFTASHYLQQHIPWLHTLQSFRPEIMATKELLASLSLPRPQDKEEENHRAVVPTPRNAIRLGPILARLRQSDNYEEVVQVLQDLENVCSRVVCAPLDGAMNDLRPMMSSPNLVIRNRTYMLILRYLKDNPHAASDLLPDYLDCLDNRNASVVTSALDRLPDFLLLCQENGEQLLQKAFSLAVEGGFNVLPNLKETLMLLQLHSGTAP